jgi:hypothetical protein
VSGDIDAATTRSARVVKELLEKSSNRSSTSGEPLTLAELTDLLRFSLECAEQACFNGLRFDFYEPRHRYAVLLLWAVLDYARDVLALIQAVRCGAIAIVTRSALDAYADIANLGDRPQYWEHLVAADASKWKQILERASRGGNPMLKALSEDALLPVGRRKHALELKALQAKGVEKLDIGERFERAQLTNEYESMYSFLSSEVHNNVSGLQSRYIDWDESRAWLVPTGESSGHSQHYEEPCTLTMSEIVIKSTEKVLTLLGHGTAVMSPASAELEKIWKRAEAQEATQQTLAEVPRTGA